MTLPGTAAAANTTGTTNAMTTSGESDQPQGNGGGGFSGFLWDFAYSMFDSNNPISQWDSFRSVYADDGGKIGALSEAMSSGIEQKLSIAQRNETYAKLADPDSRITVDQAGQEVNASRQQLGREIANDANTVKEAVVAGVDLTVKTAIVIEGGRGVGRFDRDRQSHASAQGLPRSLYQSQSRPFRSLLRGARCSKCRGNPKGTCSWRTRVE